MKPTILYCKVYKNRITIKNLFSGKTKCIDDCIFSNDTYLLADLNKAISAVKSEKKEILRRTIADFCFEPLVLIQPMELSNTDLCEVEKSLLEGLIQNSKISSRPVVWHGEELSDEEVFSKFPKFKGKSFRLGGNYTQSKPSN